MKRLLKKLKKGVSLVEVVIAIAVISIISVSAVTVVTLSVQNQKKSILNFDIANTCNVVIDCFRYNNDLSSLSSIYNDKYNSTDKTIDRSAYKLYITVNGDKTLTLIAKDLKGNELYKLENVK